MLLFTWLHTRSFKDPDTNEDTDGRREHPQIQESNVTEQQQKYSARGVTCVAQSCERQNTKNTAKQKTIHWHFCVIKSERKTQKTRQKHQKKKKNTKKEDTTNQSLQQSYHS